jgi:hypothetical protein
MIQKKRVLWQRIDAEMKAAFDQMQQESDSTEPWRKWDDESRCLWDAWCSEIDTLRLEERLKLDLWRQLGRFQGDRAQQVQLI